MTKYNVLYSYSNVLKMDPNDYLSSERKSQRKLIKMYIYHEHFIASQTITNNNNQLHELQRSDKTE